MSNKLTADYRGLDLVAIADNMDQLFGFESAWETRDDSDGHSWELNGRIIVNLPDLDRLCEVVEAGPGDIGHVFRYVFAHLKTHHYQELTPSYAKPYSEDIRPYELDADLTAGWICANAAIANSFRRSGIALFHDFNRLEEGNGTTNRASTRTVTEYPWPEERDLAFLRGARMWAAGQISSYNTAATRQGIPNQTFPEFLAEVPAIVHGMWSRSVPNSIEDAKRRIVSVA